MTKLEHEALHEPDSPSEPERTGTSGMTQEEIRRKMGIAFEEENARRDVERWRNATDQERAEELRQCVLMAEALNKAAGHEPDTEPKPRFPTPRHLRPGV